MKHVHGVGKEIYNCEFCGKIFKSNTNLQLHVDRIHSDSFCHVCDVCGKSFKVKCDLKKHKEIHMEKTIVCPVPECGCKFGNQRLCNAHVKKCHRILKKEHKCEHCGKTYNQNQKLQHHIAVVHRGERPFPCNECDFRAACKFFQKTISVRPGQPIWDSDFMWNQFWQFLRPKNCHFDSFRGPRFWFW